MKLELGGFDGLMAGMISANVDVVLTADAVRGTLVPKDKLLEIASKLLRNLDE